MPKICNINPDGTLGSEIDNGVCWGFLGRLDDYDTFGSTVAEYVQDGGCTRVAAVAGVPAEFDNEALPYLTWLMEHSPYRKAFLCTGYEAVQQGYATVDLTACNQTLILGLSHLRRSQPWMHQMWNSLPSSIPDGLKYLVCVALNPTKQSRVTDLGSGEGDNTSTVLDRFCPKTWHAWLENTELPFYEAYCDLGGYSVGFCTRYEDAFWEDEESGLRNKLQGLSQFGTEVHEVQGLFFKDEVISRSTSATDALEFIIKELEGTPFCVQKYLNLNREAA